MGPAKAARTAKVGWVYSDEFLEHDAGPGHPERADLLRAIT